MVVLRLVALDAEAPGGAGARVVGAVAVVALAVAPGRVQARAGLVATLAQRLFFRLAVGRVALRATLRDLSVGALLGRLVALRAGLRHLARVRLMTLLALQVSGGRGGPLRLMAAAAGQGATFGQVRAGEVAIDALLVALKHLMALVLVAAGTVHVPAEGVRLVAILAVVLVEVVREQPHGRGCYDLCSEHGAGGRRHCGMAADAGHAVVGQVALVGRVAREAAVVVSFRRRLDLMGLVLMAASASGLAGLDLVWIVAADAAVLRDLGRQRPLLVAGGAVFEATVVRRVAPAAAVI